MRVGLHFSRIYLTFWKHSEDLIGTHSADCYTYRAGAAFVHTGITHLPRCTLDASACELSEQRHGHSQTSSLRVSHREQTLKQAALVSGDTSEDIYQCAPRTNSQHSILGRGSAQVVVTGRRGAKCRLRLLRLGGNMRSWVLVLLVAVFSAALMRLGSAEVRPEDVCW